MLKDEIETSNYYLIDKLPLSRIIAMMVNITTIQCFSFVQFLMI
jgi:hypothetical protein